MQNLKALSKPTNQKLHFSKIPDWSVCTFKFEHQKKTLMLGKTEIRRRRGWQRMRWLDGITNSMDMSLSKLQEIVGDKGAHVLQSMGSQKVRCKIATGQQHFSASLPGIFKSKLCYMILPSPANLIRPACWNNCEPGHWPKCLVENGSMNQGSPPLLLNNLGYLPG